MTEIFGLLPRIEPMQAILAWVLLLLLWSLLRAHADTRREDFDLSDLIMHNGKIDKFAFCFMSAFAMMTWMIIHMVVKGTITEGYLTIYAASWVAPLTAKVIWGKPYVAEPAPPPNPNPTGV